MVAVLKGIHSLELPQEYEGKAEKIWSPHRGTQIALLTCPCREILFGGAAGGGKTDGTLGYCARGIEEWGSAWRILVVRRSQSEFEEIENRFLEILGPVYGTDCYLSSKHIWKIPTAKGTATIKLQSAADSTAIRKITGRAWNIAAIDEAGEYPDPEVLEYINTRLRSPYGAPIATLLTANPGGVGHSWLVDRFQIEKSPPMVPIPYRIGKEIKHRVFIPSLVSDNYTLMANDTSYANQLEGIADPTMRRALRFGDWNVTAGAAFPEFDSRVHVIPHFPPPPGVRIWRSMDWGYDKPSAVLWFFIDADGYTHVFHELYTKGARYNEGARMLPEVVLDRIHGIEESYGIESRLRYLDPGCWQEQSGPTTIYHQLGGARERWQKWPTGPNWRANKKMMVHEHLKVVNGVARIKIHDNCVDLIRTLRTIPTDPHDPEDVSTHAEDHLYDALGGGLARVVVPPKRKKYDPVKDLLFSDPHPGDTGDVGEFGGW